MTSDPFVSKMLYSVAEACQAIGLCRKSLYAHSQPRGPIPVVRIGARVMYDPADLRAWIDQQKGGQDA